MSKLGIYRIQGDHRTAAWKRHATAAVDLLNKGKELQRNNQLHTVNIVHSRYTDHFTERGIRKIAGAYHSKDINIPVVVAQTIESLHEGLPHEPGRLVFYGQLSYSQGNKVCNKAFMNYMEGKTSAVTKRLRLCFILFFKQAVKTLLIIRWRCSENPFTLSDFERLKWFRGKMRPKWPQGWR